MVTVFASLLFATQASAAPPPFHRVRSLPVPMAAYMPRLVIRATTGFIPLVNGCAAYDLRTLKQIWKWTGPDSSTYSLAVGKSVFVALSGNVGGVAALNPQTGKELWRIPWRLTGIQNPIACDA